MFRRKQKLGVGLVPHRTSRGLGAILVLSIFFASTQTVCVLAAPNDDLPSPPLRRPVILKAAVFPSSTQILATFPDKFLVPVEVLDTSLTFQYRAFVDYESENGFAQPASSGESVADYTSRQPNVRLLSIRIEAPVDLSVCHLIEVLVANRFKGEDEGRPAHTPEDPPGGDIVSWFYSPSGTLIGCPSYVESASDGGTDSQALIPSNGIDGGP